MMAETRCPYCGASEDANGPRLTFECGSGGSCESSVIRAAPCYCREINGLKAENELLKAEVERQRKEINDACASLTMISLCATDGTNLITLVDAANDTAGDLHQQLAAANAKIDELEQSATKLEEVLSLVRSSLMEHGDCKSHLRYSNGLPMACTACMARIKLSEIVSEWKGPTVKLAADFAAKEE